MFGPAIHPFNQTSFFVPGAYELPILPAMLIDQ
jgi:hypothetical protein